MSQHKVLIIGAGPAAYTAALYTGRAQLAPLIMAGPKAGGQLMWTTDVENYPGFPEGIEGPKLMMSMMKQAERFGAELRYDYVTAVDFTQRPFRAWTNSAGDKTAEEIVTAKPEEYSEFRSEIIKAEPALTADSVILATGATSIMVGVPGEQELMGKGVSTCAVCDAAFFKEKETFVIGGGDSAMEEALALTKFAKSVTIIHRRDEFRASKIMQDRVLKHEKVKVLWNTELKEVRGETGVTEIVIDEAGTEKVLPAEGVFIAIGHRPSTGILRDQVALDDHGYVVTRQSATAAGVEAAQAALGEEGKVAFPSMTSVEGVFAGGDNVDIRYKQAVTAAGQGCSAALDVERWLESQE
ncbi:MAG: FAD-dependent oxidoreductase [Patescibacteria group bacterium]